MLKAIAATLIVVLAIFFFWHLFVFVLGSAIAITATIWGFLIASVVVLSICILLLFILTGMGVFIMGIAAFVWTLIAIILFPVLFPVIAPIFIIFLFLFFYRKRNLKKLKHVQGVEKK
jgi:hypothetical protein